MPKELSHTILFMISSFFGGLVGAAINTLMSDLYNKWSWIMFVVVIIVISLIVYWVLKAYYNTFDKKSSNMTEPHKELQLEPSSLITKLEERRFSIGFLSYMALGIIIGIIAINLGLGYINQGKQLYEYSEHQNYDIYFQFITKEGNNSKEIFLDDAKFYYDLTKKEGYVSFIVNYNIGEIYMDLDTQINEKDIKCYVTNYTEFKINNNYMESPCKKEVRDNKTVIITFYDNSFYDKIIRIDFNNTFYSPVSTFNIYTSNTWNSYGDNGNFIFNLGNDYECFQDCVYPILNVETLYESNLAKERHLKIIEPHSDKFYVFEVITASKNILDKKNLSFAYGIAIGVGAFFALITIAIAIIQLLLEIPKSSKDEEEINKLKTHIKLIEKGISSEKRVIGSVYNHLLEIKGKLDRLEKRKIRIKKEN